MDNYYKQHCENLKMLERAIKAVSCTLREHISLNQEMNSLVYTMILSHLTNSWAEVRLMKLVYELGGFSDLEKIEIITCRSLEKKWEMALNKAFCKAFKVKDPKKL